MRALTKWTLSGIILLSGLSAHAAVRIRCARGNYTVFVEEHIAGRGRTTVHMFQLHRLGMVVGIGHMALVEEGYQQSFIPAGAYVWRFEAKDKSSYLEVSVPQLKSPAPGQTYICLGDVHIQTPGHLMDGSGVPCEVQIL